MRSGTFLVAGVLLLASACGDGNASNPDTAPPRVVGLITQIEPPEGGPPQNFTVEEEDGDAYTIDIDPNHDYGFDLNHLYEHWDAEEPVAVAVKVSDGRLVAESIDDV